ncbi:MAG: J domain-containing protein [Deltaproteobacteria bacterium]|nr:J domain-containing protein [Deltaproteobacteria bacterium]
MALKDYYRLLGVEREASDQEIKKAYRQLAMEYHPDRNQDKPECEERLKEINEAYQVLGDEDKRRQYDLFCRQPFYRDGYGPENPSDDLTALFRAFARRGGIMKGFGRCGGMGFGRGGCGRWKRNF